jgi:hypothetical protein
MNPTARFFNAQGVVVGLGVLINSGELLTASHVLNVAAGVEWDRKDTRKGEVFDVDFPFVDPPVRVTAKVDRWLAPELGKGDIATLLLPPDVSIESSTLLDPGVVLASGATVRAWFGAADDPVGTVATGTLAGKSSGEWYQIDQAIGAQHKIQHGYSGSPVWDQDDQLLGIIWGGRSEAATSYLIPAGVLFDRRAGVSRDRGQPAWRFDYIFSDLLPSLLNDLVKHETDGIDPDKCLVIQGSLGQLTNELSVIEGETLWSSQPHLVANTLATTYQTWNGFRNGPTGAPMRAAELESLRFQRTALRRESAKFGTLLYESLLEKEADRIVDHFVPIHRLLDSSGREMFPEVRRSVKKYRKLTAKHRP